MNKFFSSYRTGRRQCFFLVFVFFLSFSAVSQDLLKSIPASASGVLTIDGASFFKKIDLHQINRLEMFQELDEGTQGRKGNKYNEYSKIYKDPASIGLNVLSKAYLYFENSKDTMPWSGNYSYSAILIGLNKSKKFENFMKKVSDEPIQSIASYKFIHNNYSNIIAWNKTQVVVLWINGYWKNKDSMLLQEFYRITHLSPEACIKSNKNFMESQLNKFDFSYWMNFESLFSSFAFGDVMGFPFMKNLPFIGADFYKGYYLQLFLNFNQGSVKLDTKQYLSEESAKKVDNVYGSGINPDLLKYVHKDHLLGIYSYSLNMKGIKSILDTALHDTVKTKLNETFVEFLYKGRINQDANILAMEKKIDSIYAEIYNPSYGSDVTSVDSTETYEEDYSDTYGNSYEEADSSYTEDYNNSYQDTISVSPHPSIGDTTSTVYPNYESIDSVMADTIATEYYQEYSSSKSDSLFEAKQQRIDSIRTLINGRKKELLGKKTEELALANNDILELFEGDIMGAITDYYFIQKKYKTYEYDEEELKTKEVEKTKSDPFPEFVVAMTLNNVKKASSLMEKLHKDSLLLKKEDYYYFSDGDHSVMTAISGNILLITNDKELVSNYLQGYKKDETLPKEIQELVLNKNTSMYISLKEIFARLPFKSLSKQRHDMYTLLMNSLGTVSLISDTYKGNVSNSELIFKVTNKIDNSFYEILRIINEAYKINKSQY